MTTVDPRVERLYNLDELLEMRRNVLRYARTFPPGHERNQHRHVAVSLRLLFKDEKWLRDHVRNDSWHAGLVVRGKMMQKFFFDMKDGVPMRDRVGIDFKGNLEAIEHCKELARHFRDESLRDDKNLEISVVNSLGREIHREFVHRQ
jgi:hypothetical protein